MPALLKFGVLHSTDISNHSSSLPSEPGQIKFKTIILFIFCLLYHSTALAWAADNSSSSPEEIPFTTNDNRLFVTLMLNGKGPFVFIFDTGGCFSLTPTAAKKLNLNVTPDGRATGAGDKSVPMSHAVVKSTSIGSLEFANQNYLVIDYSPIQKAFKFSDLDGILGYEVLQQYSVKIDYERQTLLSMRDTKSLDLAGYSRIPCKFEFCKPVINGTIDEKKARILVDTGDRSALTLRSEFVSAHATLENNFKGSRIVCTGYGIGGPIPGKLSRIAKLQLTPGLLLTNVMTRTPTTKSGFNSMKEIDASIGNEVLKHFDVVFDYRDSCVYLRKNAMFESTTSFRPVQ